MRRLFLLAGLLPLLGTGACSTVSGIQGRVDAAEHIAAPAGLHRMDIQTGTYRLATWQKITDPAAPINVYIEGDGLAWISRQSPSPNPTPTRAVALELAALDPAPNVVYLARPCQFVPAEDNPACSVQSWTGRRFSEDIVASVNAALNDLTTAATTTTGADAKFNLIGFSGGGNIALLLAARRDDVISVRTVAGNIDIGAFNAFHHTSPMPDSLSARDVAVELENLPQMHFIGAQDEIVPADIYNAYAGAAGASPCLSHEIVEGATHTEGWAEVWPTLLSRPIPCVP